MGKIVNKLQKFLKLKVNSDRYTDKQIKHLGEHIDNAMTELAYAANIAAELIKHQSKAKRKSDK